MNENEKRRILREYRSWDTDPLGMVLRYVPQVTGLSLPLVWWLLGVVPAVLFLVASFANFAHGLDRGMETKL